MKTEIKITIENAYPNASVKEMAVENCNNEFEIFGQKTVMERENTKIIVETDTELQLDDFEILNFTTLNIQKQIPCMGDTSVNVLEIAVKQGKEEVNLPVSRFGRFAKYPEWVPNMNRRLSYEEYWEIAKFVRKQDKIENLQNAIGNYMGAANQNIAEYILEGKNLVKNAELYDDHIGDIISGEDEYQALCQVVNECGGAALYRLISNKGTDDELEDEVVLMKKQAEEIKKGNCNKIIKDEFGYDIDLACVSEIIFIKDLVEF